MSYRSGGHPGAVAVSYSAGMMSTPLSPTRRYSSESSTTTTLGIRSSSSKLSSYRPSTSSSIDRDRPSFYGSGTTPTTNYGTSHRSSYSGEYRRYSSPARSLSVSSSAFSDTGSGNASSSSCNRYSVSSSRDRSEHRETPGSLATSAADIIAKYSPANYIPNISGSSAAAQTNGYSISSPTAIFGGNASNAKTITREPSNELSTSTLGRPPRPVRKSPVSTLLNNHAQPDSTATEVTQADKNNNGNVGVSHKIIKNDNGDGCYVDGSCSELASSISRKTCCSSPLAVGVSPNLTCLSPLTNPSNPTNTKAVSNNNNNNNNNSHLDEGTEPRNGENDAGSQENATRLGHQATSRAVENSLSPLSAEKTANTDQTYSSIGHCGDAPLPVDQPGLSSVVRNGVIGRPTGTQGGDLSLPSTSRRGDTYSGNGTTSNGSTGLSSPSSSVSHQNIYRGISEQIEGSPTIRTLGSRLQTPRDERCGLNGLRNIGNTCFMNSVIQCLSNTRPLLEYLLNEQYLADINTTTSSMKGALIKAFSQVIQELWEVGGDHVVNTASLKSQIQRFAPRFMGYSQQDAQEFLRYLLEGLHEDVNRVTARQQPILTDIPDHYPDSQKAAESWKRYLRNEDSTIVDVFVGQLRSSLHCTSCGHVSVTLDPFWDLSLPIPTRSGTVKLNQCLEHFTKEEILDGDEKPTCSKCQTRRKCTKSFSIQKFPKILVIHLKRFSPMERFRGKLNTLVDFPLTGLDLSAFSAPRVAGCTYNLYGVANHSGTTYSGHYTAYCKHPYSGEWHEYNDSRVSSIAARSVVSSEGYVLFYEQQLHSSNL